MSLWIPVEGDFIRADVIRWKEAIWEKRGSRASARARKIGEREIIAEVLTDTDEDGWVELLIRDCKPTVEAAGRHSDGMPKKKSRVRRKAATVMRGQPDRLTWEDESARAAVRGEVYSKFLVPGSRTKKRPAWPGEDG